MQTSSHSMGCLKSLLSDIFLFLTLAPRNGLVSSCREKFNHISTILLSISYHIHSSDLWINVSLTDAQWPACCLVPDSMALTVYCERPSGYYLTAKNYYLGNVLCIPLVHFLLQYKRPLLFVASI